MPRASFRTIASISPMLKTYARYSIAIRIAAMARAAAHMPGSSPSGQEYAAAGIASIHAGRSTCAEWRHGDTLAFRASSGNITSASLLVPTSAALSHLPESSRVSLREARLPFGRSPEASRGCC